MTDIEMVIFDCDGVLVDSEVLAAEAYRTVLGRIGVAVSDAALRGCVGMKPADILAMLSAATGQPIAAEQMADLWPTTRALFDARLTATAGAAAFLAALPLRRCVASSSPHERIALSLRRTGLDGYFPAGAVFSSSEVARGKPAPDLFLHAAARMGVAPGRCVVIEDSRYGVAGAVAAGMAALGFTGGSHADAASAAALTAAGAVAVERSWPAIAARLGLFGTAAAQR